MNYNKSMIYNESHTLLHSYRQESAKQGWTSSPDERGTLDIIWTCIFTMFLCSWSVICMNVPGPDDTTLDVFMRKFWNTCLCLLGPEFSMLNAMGQWRSASESVVDFRKSGYLQWTMNHAFFADMGGFVLHSPDCAPFPLNAKQLHYMVNKGHVAFPSLDKRLILDKNKADGLLRLVSLFQTFWFLLNIIGRASQKLSITGLELTTAAFIGCTVVTTFCWAHKPADITISEAIQTNTSIAEVLCQAGRDAHAPYHQTPLEFISRNEWPWTIYWSNWINILRHMGFRFVQDSKPVKRFANTEVPEVKGWLLAIYYLMYSAYCAVFFGGWNFVFPTKVEQTLWRAASVVLLCSGTAFALVTTYAFYVHPFICKLFGNSGTSGRVSDGNIGLDKHDCRASRVARAAAAAVRNNSVDKDPALTVPLKAILPVYISAFLYCNARTYIFIADIIEFRALPVSAFRTVQWSSFLPHV